MSLSAPSMSTSNLPHDSSDSSDSSEEVKNEPQSLLDPPRGQGIPFEGIVDAQDALRVLRLIRETVSPSLAPVRPVPRERKGFMESPPLFEAINKYLDLLRKNTDMGIAIERMRRMLVFFTHQFSLEKKKFEDGKAAAWAMEEDISKKQEDQIRSMFPEGDKCGICQEYYGLSLNPPGTKLNTCGHIFHFCCITKTAIGNRGLHNDTSCQSRFEFCKCPLCNAPFSPKDLVGIHDVDKKLADANSQLELALCKIAKMKKEKRKKGRKRAHSSSGQQEDRSVTQRTS